MLDGSGTPVLAIVYVASSSVNDPPAGSPVIVTLETPPGNATRINSFGLLPGSPESASLLEYVEVAVATWLLPPSKASSTTVL